MSREREEMKFRAIWELSCRATPQKRRTIGAQREEHTIILVEKPISERYKATHSFSCSFWVYLDGFEAYYYAREANSEIRGLRHFPTPAYAPEEERFLLALAAAHSLYPDRVERSIPVPLLFDQREEQIYEGELWLRVPPSSRGWALHPYTQSRRQWRVTLGNASCGVVCYLYSSDAYWFEGECWQPRIENWCFMPAYEEAIEVYSCPGKQQQVR